MRNPASGGPVVPDAGPPGPQPRPVLLAVRLMYAGAALTAVGLLVSLLQLHGLRTAIIAASKTHLTASQVTATERAIVGSTVISGVIGIGLWLLMARANGRGRKWARLVASGLFAINTLGLISSVAVAHTAAGLALTVLIWLVGAGAIVLLWQRDSGGYFA